MKRFLICFLFSFLLTGILTSNAEVPITVPTGHTQNTTTVAATVTGHTRKSVLVAAGVADPYCPACFSAAGVKYYHSDTDFTRVPECNCTEQIVSNAITMYPSSKYTVTTSTKTIDHTCNNNWPGAQKQTIHCVWTYTTFTPKVASCTHNANCQPHGRDASGHAPGSFTVGTTTVTCPTCSKTYTKVTCAHISAKCSYGFTSSQHGSSTHPNTISGSATCTCGAIISLSCIAPSNKCDHGSPVCSFGFMAGKHPHTSGGITYTFNGTSSKQTCTICKKEYTLLACEPATVDPPIVPPTDPPIVPPTDPPIVPPAIPCEFIPSPCSSTHALITIGDPNPSKPADTPLSLNGAINQNKFYQIGDTFSLTGYHHTAREAAPSLPPASSSTPCSNSISYTCTQHGASCPSLPAPTACNAPIPTETYTTICTETLHPVTFSFKGFTIDQAIPILTPNPASGSSINTTDTYDTSSLTITGLKYSELKYDTVSQRPYGEIIATCTNAGSCTEVTPPQRVYFAFTPEVITGIFTKSLRAVSVRDLRWKDYFLNGGEPYYIEASKKILVDDSKLPIDALKTGYAVEFAFNTINTPLNSNVYLKIDTKLYKYDESSQRIGSEIEFDEIGDALTGTLLSNSNSLYKSFTSKDSNAVKMFLIKAEADPDNANGIKWNWVYYLPPKLVTTSGDSTIVVKSDIKLVNSNNKVIWDYVNVLTRTSPRITNWDGNLFKYDLTQSLLDDFDNTVNY